MAPKLYEMFPSYPDLEESRIVITGGGNGVGAYVALGLVAQGAYPIVIDIVPFKESEIEGLIRTYNDELAFRTLIPDGAFEYYQQDCLDRKGMQAIFDNYPALEGLVNHVGLIGNADAPGDAFGERLLSAHIATELAHPRIKAGSIVFMNSLEVSSPEYEPTMIMAVNAGLETMRWQYAMQLAPDVRVNTVTIGLVRTKKKLAQFNHDEARLMALQRENPLKRIAEPYEIANTVIYLLSGASSYITGQNIRADGGISIANQ